MTPTIKHVTINLAIPQTTSKSTILSSKQQQQKYNQLHSSMKCASNNIMQAVQSLALHFKVNQFTPRHTAGLLNAHVLNSNVIAR